MVLAHDVGWRVSTPSVAHNPEGIGFPTLGTAQQLCPFAPCAICVHLRIGYLESVLELCKERTTAAPAKTCKKMMISTDTTVRSGSTDASGRCRSVSHFTLTVLPFGTDLSFKLSNLLGCVSLFKLKPLQNGAVSVRTQVPYLARRASGLLVVRRSCWSAYTCRRTFISKIGSFSASIAVLREVIIIIII